MKLKRTNKKKTDQPNTKVVDFGISKVLDKIDKAINLLKRWCFGKSNKRITQAARKLSTYIWCRTT
jgi:hypothetical protein